MRADYINLVSLLLLSPLRVLLLGGRWLWFHMPQKKKKKKSPVFLRAGRLAVKAPLHTEEFSVSFKFQSQPDLGSFFFFSPSRGFPCFMLKLFFPSSQTFKQALHSPTPSMSCRRILLSTCTV